MDLAECICARGFLLRLVTQPRRARLHKRLPYQELPGETDQGECPGADPVEDAQDRGLLVSRPAGAQIGRPLNEPGRQPHRCFGARWLRRSASGEEAPSPRAGTLKDGQSLGQLCPG